MKPDNFHFYLHSLNWSIYDVTFHTLSPLSGAIGPTEDTTEIIEVIHKKWSDSNYGKVVSEIEIIQARRDTFYYSFDSIEMGN